MKNNYDVSVCIITYNPDKDKLKSTFKSVLQQKDIEFEIVIADDGTVRFDEENWIERYFSDNFFTHYKIVKNKQNCGTVKNYYSALENAHGKWIKALSPGDLLYDEYTLKKLVIFAGSTKKLIIGVPLYYTCKEGRVEIIKAKAPVIEWPFFNKRFAKFDYIRHINNHCGASFFIERDLIISYIAKIMMANVKYAEDVSYFFMMADGVDYYYFQYYIIWYEFGDGISTSQSNKWQYRIRKDFENAAKQFVMEHSNMKYGFGSYRNRIEYAKYCNSLEMRLFNYLAYNKGICKKTRKYDESILTKLLCESTNYRNG